MVVQGSLVGITAQFTSLASNEIFSSVEHRNVYKHECRSMSFTAGKRQPCCYKFNSLISCPHLLRHSRGGVTHASRLSGCQHSSLVANEV